MAHKRSKEVKPMLCPPDPKFLLKAEMGHIHCINYSFTDNKRFLTLYVGTEDGEVYIWNVTTQQLCLKEKVGYPILNILFYDSTIITQEKDGTFKLFVLEEEGLNLIWSTMVTNKSFCKSIIIDHWLVVPAEEGIQMYNVKTMTISNSLSNDKEKNYGMLMCITKVETSFGLYILVVYETGDGVLWDTIPFRMIGTIKFNPLPISVTFEKKKGRGVAVGLSEQIQIFEVRSPHSKDIEVVYHIEVPSANFTVVKSRPDGKVFVVGGSDGNLRYFSWKSLKLLVVLTEHPSEITDIQFIPNEITDCDKTTMVASSADGSISFWDLY